jgi:hypothetical protein
MQPASQTDDKEESLFQLKVKKAEPKLLIEATAQPFFYAF